MYADYNYYKDTFKGKRIPGNDFDTYSVKASSYIKYITLNRVGNNVTDDIKMATCEIAELYYDQEIQKNDIRNIISSESVGTRKVTYNNTNKIKTDKGMDEELYNIAHKHLFLTGLLYRGI